MAPRHALGYNAVRSDPSRLEEDAMPTRELNDTRQALYDLLGDLPDRDRPIACETI